MSRSAPVAPIAQSPRDDLESRQPPPPGCRRFRSASPASCCLPTFAKPGPGLPLVKKVIAEFLGTFILIFSAAATPIVNQKYDGAATLLGAATSAGLAVCVVIISIGHISGAHLNPSVTIAFAAARHFPWTHVPGYVVAQVLGSTAASFALKAIFHPFHSGGVTVPTLSTAQAFFLEFVITFTLMFVIVAVATDTRAVRELAGVAIGATVLLNVLVAG
ncbi:hypothetical protein MUK42_18831 [Musa troglodytarum]|nr:hypothetical protein MUK42_18831 [Musa troglodytarum]